MEPAPVTARRCGTTVIELENSTWVVERGVRHTEWFVKVGGAWTRLADVPEVAATHAADDPDTADEESSFMQRPPGCQYLCRFRLLLAVGTPVRRRVSMPRDTRRSRRASDGRAVTVDLQRDVLRYFKFAKPPLSISETEFRVARRGLVTADRWERALAERAIVR